MPTACRGRRSRSPDRRALTSRLSSPAPLLSCVPSPDRGRAGGGRHTPRPRCPPWRRITPLRLPPPASPRRWPPSPGCWAFVADLDPDTLLGADAAALYASLAKLERLVGAAKCLLAPRIAASGHWEAEGHRSPAGLLATLEGVPTGQARRTLETGPAPGRPARHRGGPAGRGPVGPEGRPAHRRRHRRPRREGTLLAGAADEGLAATKERCLRVRATSARHDPLAAARRIHAERHFSHWTDAEGAFCFSGRDSAERGAALLARLVPAANRLRDARRAAATAVTPRPGGPTSTGAASHAVPDRDRHPDPGPSPRPPCGPTPCSPWSPAAPRPGETDRRARRRRLVRPGRPPARLPPSPPTPGLLGADDLAGRPPPATVIVRVDRDALVRGRALPGELCELDGQGPIPVPAGPGPGRRLLPPPGLHRGRRHPGRRPPGPDHQRHPAHRPHLPGPVLCGAGVRHALRAGDRPRRPDGVRRGHHARQPGPAVHPPPPDEDLRRVGARAARAERRRPAVVLHPPAPLRPGARPRTGPAVTRRPTSRQSTPPEPDRRPTPPEPDRRPDRRATLFDRPPEVVPRR